MTSFIVPSRGSPLVIGEIWCKNLLVAQNPAPFANIISKRVYFFHACGASSLDDELPVAHNTFSLRIFPPEFESQFEGRPLLSHAWGFNGENVHAECRQQQPHILEERFYISRIGLWQPSTNWCCPV